MQNIIYKKEYLIGKLILFYLLTITTFSYSQKNLFLKKVEIYSFNEIDNSFISIENNSIIKIKNNDLYSLSNDYVQNIFQYVYIFFITKEKPIYKKFEVKDGFMNSHNSKLKIIVYYNCGKYHESTIDLAKDGFEIETTNEFNEFLKIIYGGYKIKWKKID